MKHPIEAAADAGLTTFNQSRAIMFLANGPKGTSALAKFLQIKPGSASQIFGRLRGSFLIEPVPATLPGFSMHDRREKPFQLTAKGKALAEALTYAPLACYSPTTSTAHS